MRKLIIKIALLTFLVATVYSDGPIDSYNIEYGNISEFILKNTQGIMILDIASIESHSLLTYTLVGEEMQSSDTLSIFETLPVSQYGSPVTSKSPPNAPFYSLLRFPIVNQTGDYFQIVSNCRTGEAVWVKNQGEGAFHRGMIILLNEMPTESTQYYLDLRFNPRENVRFYENPSMDSKYKDIPQHFYTNSQTGTWFRIDEQVGEFIHIYSQSSECGFKGPIVEIGWLPIRDKSGKLNFWIYNYDDC